MPLTPGMYMYMHIHVHVHVLRSVVEAKDDPGTSYTRIVFVIGL